MKKRAKSAGKAAGGESPKEARPQKRQGLSPLPSGKAGCAGGKFWRAVLASALAAAIFSACVSASSAASDQYPPPAGEGFYEEPAGYAAGFLPEQPEETVAFLPQAPPAVPPELPPERRGSLIFVIDDAGNSLLELEPFLNFPGALTIAVLPGLPHSAEAARRARAAGMEVILHQPMEAVGGHDPGPQAIYSWMDAQEVRAVLERNLQEVGPVTGMNNHMGSLITANEEVMETVLAFAKENGIFFLDSRTTAATVVPAVARRLGMAIAERDVFIDNDPSAEAMRRMITAGASLAGIRGRAVMIGHVQSGALAPLLHELYPQLTEQGFDFAPAASVFDSGDGQTP